MKVIFYILILFTISACGESKKRDLSNNIEVVSKDLPKVTLNNQCHFETYVKYIDSLPVYDKANGQIIKYFRFEDNPNYDFGGGFLFKDSELGWLQIGKDEYNPELENYWIKSDFIEVGTNNYKGQEISLRKEPTMDSEITGVIIEESYLNVLNCKNDWVFVEKEKTKGWLSPKYICTNSETNCN